MSYTLLSPDPRAIATGELSAPPVRRRVGGIGDPEPLPLDHPAADWRRALPVLCGEVVFAQGPLDLREGLEGFALGMQRLAGFSFEDLPVAKIEVLIGFGDRRRHRHG